MRDAVSTWKRHSVSTLPLTHCNQICRITGYGTFDGVWISCTLNHCSKYTNSVGERHSYVKQREKDVKSWNEGRKKRAAFCAFTGKRLLDLFIIPLLAYIFFSVITKLLPTFYSRWRCMDMCTKSFFLFIYYLNFSRFCNLFFYQKSASTVHNTRGITGNILDDQL